MGHACSAPAKLDGASATRALDTIERNARAQARLIDDLLDVSRIITGKLRLDAAAGRPGADRRRGGRRRCGPAADAKGSAATSLERRAPRRRRSRSAAAGVWNLLSNAIKFTPRGGARATVRARARRLARRVVGRDTGEGIAPEFLPHVFERFRQADGSITREHGGLGLGLAIVRHLVEMHGGSINAESAGLGLGSVFTVELPLAEERRDPARAEERRREVERRRSRRDTVRLDGVHVLLVEDDDDSRKLLCTMLKRHGAKVTATKSAAEALNVFSDEAPDLLISDIGMPDEDGYEFIRKLRALPAEKGGRTPAIALTGYASRKDRERALAAGYHQHLAETDRTA